MRNFVLSCLWVFGLVSCSSLPKLFKFDIQSNVAFREGPRVTMDVYRPRRSGPAPAVIVIPGGSWRSRSADLISVSRDLAAQGFVAFNIAYRLAPANIYPAALDDVRASLAYVKSHHQDLGVNPDEIFVWGYSAGGHLGLLLGLDPKSGIKGIVSGGAPTNFPSFPKSPLIRDFVGATFLENPALWREASPINHVSPNSPPVFMYHGTTDKLVYVDQMTIMADRLRENGVLVQTKEVGFWGHSGVYLFSSSSVAEGIAFLKKRLATSNE